MMPTMMQTTMEPTSPPEADILDICPPPNIYLKGECFDNDVAINGTLDLREEDKDNRTLVVGSTLTIIGSFKTNLKG
jgi:hypothetical protein